MGFWKELSLSDDLFSHLKNIGNDILCGESTCKVKISFMLMEKFVKNEWILDNNANLNAMQYSYVKYAVQYNIYKITTKLRFFF